jgi:16S rRNA (guanine527-N7)-methyltransferase
VSENIFKYFPFLSEIQREKLLLLETVYNRWNSMINVISRKDMENFMVHHVLHSIALAKVITFLPQTTILDVGTGGGFPGIPLAIMFPDSEFTLLDSIGKKIKVVHAVAEELGIDNVIPSRKRVEDEHGKYHFIISRAVTTFPEFVSLTSKNIDKSGNNDLENGIFCFKGGDLSAELKHFNRKAKVWDIKNFFEEPFFETKKIVYLPVRFF